MKLAIMQPYLFPYIGYWQLIKHVDTFVIYDDVNFIKKGYINRNYLLSDGSAQRFTLEVIGASQNRKINELLVGNNTEKLLKTIKILYGRSPNFSETFQLIKEILEYPERNLAKFIGNSLVAISKYLNIETQFIYSSNLDKNNNLKGQDKIIEICSILGADKYYNSIGGCSLYNREDFKKFGIDIGFIKSGKILYSQFDDEYVENLSIIDVLMFNRKSMIHNFLQEFQVV